MKTILAILDYSRTAPNVRSDKFLLLEKKGRIKEILQAVEDERKGKIQHNAIKVKRA